jgi:hypothetical protein
MCSPRNDKYNPSYSKTYLSIKSLLRTWFLCFSRLSFFAFWEDEKHVFHITAFRPTSYVLMRLKWLEVSNRVRNWNKVKNFIFVGSKIQLCQLEIPIFIYKIECQGTLINLWIYSCNELKWKQNYYFSTIIISNSQIEILVHIQGQPMSM